MSRPSWIVVWAPGAGLPSTSPWMERWRERLSTLDGVQHIRPFDYPYRREGRSRPDRLPVLVDAHAAEIAAARDAHPEARVVLAGKSMGSRVGCHVSLDHPVDALVCFGYPLVSSGKRRTLRDEVLVALRTPILFIQGTRDAMGPLDTFAEVRGRMTAPSDLHVVVTGDHSLRITKTHTKQTGRTQDDEDADALSAIDRFLDAHLATAPT